MSLDVSRLENVHQRGSRIIARCPVCAKDGNDEKGEHLVIMPDGRFGCVVYPGAAGKEHRKRISAIAGDPNTRKRGSFNVRVRRVSGNPNGHSSPEVVDMTRLGLGSANHAANHSTSVDANLPETATHLDTVGRIGRVSTTYALRVNQSGNCDHDEEHLHTRSVGRNPSNASTPVHETNDDKLGRLVDVLVPEHALSFLRRLVGERLPALSERLGKVQAATDAILLGWDHDNSDLSHRLADVNHQTLALAAAHAGMVLVGALHAGQNTRDAGETATESLCELLGFDQELIRRVVSIPCDDGLPAATTHGRNIDPETACPIIHGAICPF